MSNLLYYKALKQMALTNGLSHHVGAMLWRRNKLIAMETNSRRCNSSFTRYYRRGSANCAHAEMHVLLSAKPNDRLEVLRWKQSPEGIWILGMAKPCVHCQRRIKRIKLKVKYTNSSGQWERL